MKAIDQHTLERVDAYLTNRLTPEEVITFEADLLTDATLALALEQQREIQHAIGYQQVMTTIQSLHGRPLSRAKHKLPLWSWIAFAASILALCVFIYQTCGHGPSNENIFAEFYTQDPGLPTLMGTPDTDFAFYEGMVKYKSGDYAQAIIDWEKLSGTGRYADTLSFYLAMAHLGIEEYDNAEGYLTQTRPTSIFSDKVIWYQALIALRAGEHIKARQLLTVLSEKSGLFQSQAQVLLARLDM